jgi:hypothetical protein
MRFCLQTLLFCLISVPAFSVTVSDTIPPAIDTVLLNGNNSIDVLFTEMVEVTSAEDISHYHIDPGNIYPTYAVRDATTPASVHLTFPFSFSDRVNYDLMLHSVKDVSGITMNDTVVRVVRYVPMPYDIVIDEIMTDPSPSNGLPDVEWLEIRNISPFDINIGGWKLSKGNSRSGPIREMVLKPDSLLVICSSGSVASLSSWCSPISVTYFPSLSNAGDLISLVSDDGTTIHAVHYSDEWYHNELKKQGGWSLEMIDINNPCAGIDNWTASASFIGATPGRINSADAVNLDVSSPSLLRAYATDSVHVMLIFNEPMDSAGAMNYNQYRIDNLIGIPDAVLPLGPLFDKILLTTHIPLSQNVIYIITAEGLKDCVSNSLSGNNQARFALDSEPDSFDVVVNEILYNPKSDGVDYVELFNRSQKAFNLKNIYIANLNTSGIIDNITQLPDDGYLFFPGECLALSTDLFRTKRDYFSTQPDHILYTTSLPSFNDDEGNVILLNHQGKVLDWLHYDDNWQFPLLDETEGVSLERIHADGLTQDSGNWHSAASTVGYGTPGYRNSQNSDQNIAAGTIRVSPPVISPDNDGRDDIGIINYTFPTPGYKATMIIYDVLGRPVKHLAMNVMCGTTGFFKWDGLDDLGRKIVSGNYIMITDVFTVKGVMKRFRNVIAVVN